MVNNKKMPMLGAWLGTHVNLMTVSFEVLLILFCIGNTLANIGHCLAYCGAMVSQPVSMLHKEGQRIVPALLRLILNKNERIGMREWNEEWESDLCRITIKYLVLQDSVELFSFPLPKHLQLTQQSVQLAAQIL